MPGHSYSSSSRVNTARSSRGRKLKANRGMTSSSHRRRCMMNSRHQNRNAEKERVKQADETKAAVKWNKKESVLRISAAPFYLAYCSQWKTNGTAYACALPNKGKVVLVVRSYSWSKGSRVVNGKKTVSLGYEKGNKENKQVEIKQGQKRAYCNWL